MKRKVLQNKLEQWLCGLPEKEEKTTGDCKKMQKTEGSKHKELRICHNTLLMSSNIFYKKTSLNSIWVADILCMSHTDSM
jgi:hypothetical protein